MAIKLGMKGLRVELRVERMKDGWMNELMK